jgi:hypothetical protein
MANALHHVTEDIDLENTVLNESTTDANEAQDMLRARHVRAVNSAIAAQTADVATDDVPNAAGTASDAVITWPEDTMDDPDTDADESEEGRVYIQLEVGGETVTTAAGGLTPFDDMNTVERETPGDMDSDPLPDDQQVDERNAIATGGLPGFGDAYEMRSTSDDGDRVRALVWTDKKQATPAVIGVSSVEVTNFEFTADAGSEDRIVKLGRKTGDTTYVGVEFDYDPDVADDPVLTGRLHCLDDVDCSIEVVDGEVTAIDGFVFTGSRAEVTAVDANLHNDYLAFGVWLRDNPAASDGVDEGDDNVNERYTFGAFADGGTPADQGALDNAAGTATYRGSAAGVHSTATRVDFFYGKATLTADFDDMEVKGRIHDIYAGGDHVDHDIYLDLVTEDTANVDGGTASGRARMGPGRTGDDGNQHYPYEGTWSAGFYNPAPDDDADTTTVDESEASPGAVAGTFGVEDTTPAVTESYVGAFGAHCSGSNCND